MITVRHIDRTPLDEFSFIKLVKKYSKCETDILISFDKRLKSCSGTYIFNTDKKRHDIHISIPQAKFKDSGATIYSYVTTVLHEICHLRQKEELGRQFDLKRYNCVEEIKNPHVSEFYAPLEVSAREFENKHIFDAMEFYNNNISCTD